MPSQDVWKFTPVSYRTLALWGRRPAITPLLQLITPSRALGTADRAPSLEALLDLVWMSSCCENRGCFPSRAFLCSISLTIKLGRPQSSSPSLNAANFVAAAPASPSFPPSVVANCVAAATPATAATSASTIDITFATSVNVTTLPTAARPLCRSYHSHVAVCLNQPLLCCHPCL